MAFRFFPAVVPELFARKRLVGRIDSEVARFAFQGLKTSKGVIDFCLAGILRSQVRIISTCSPFVSPPRITSSQMPCHVETSRVSSTH